MLPPDDEAAGCEGCHPRALARAATYGEEDTRNFFSGSCLDEWGRKRIEMNRYGKGGV
jgi:hypothetical protein